MAVLLPETFLFLVKNLIDFLFNHQITRHKWALPFMEPVDVEGLGLHDYYEVIEKPMDFHTIKNRMEAKDGTGYKNVREIYADQKFEEKWLQLLPKVAEEEKSREKEQTATQVATKLAEQASYANMAQYLSNELHGVDMQLERIRKMVVHNSRKISTEEKKKIGTALTQLSHQDLIRALEIVAEHNLSFQATAQEVNLDMDTQSDVTLWRLKVFVQDALKVSGRNSGGTGMGCNSNINNDDTKAKININNKNRNTTASKRKGERCDAVTKASAKRTKKISLNSLNS
ncbi:TRANSCRIPTION FACTOR GTE1-LIKE ISOFORM X1 [Salix purpurea]|uniref:TRANSCRIPTION FACTOR GTE1-LIKE ISOFORM X1 n=1 Tax=Salix purpurea TaxID=77065 RepID=A0A9Q0YWM6_SALPP|nr:TRANSCRIPTION FACTOR GTE1-LIKE ISOFORM X1 [Salix purpurea]